MNFLPGWSVGAAARSPVNISYVSHATNDTGAATYTYTNQDIGAASYDRLVVVHVANAVAGTITGVTIGGNAAANAANTTGTSTRTSLWYLRVPTGTTATIVVSFSGAINRCHIQVLRVTRQSSDTPFDTAAPAGGGDASRTITIDAPASGGIIAAAIGDAGSVTFTNATELDDVTAAFDTLACGKYITPVNTELGRIITVNPCRAICGAAWA